MKKIGIFFENYFVFLCQNLCYLFAIVCISFVYFAAPSAYRVTITRAYESSQITYGKASDSCPLYRSIDLDDSPTGCWFYVPSTYFVSLINKASDDVYMVQYAGFTGYCKSDSISIANFTPSKPTLDNITFDIDQSAGTQIWSAPSDQAGKILTTISADTKAISYIASTIGEIPLGGSSNVWYYARYTPASSSTTIYEGYIYSEATTNLSHIPNNLEYNNEEIADNLPQNVATITLGPTIRIILITLICLPFVALFVLACIKAKRQLSSKKLEASISAAPTHKPSSTKASSRPKLSSLANKKFIKKNNNGNASSAEQPNDSDEEIIFPSYNYIDDDDLL